MTPYYYQYNFISPDPLYALIREELNSYFLSGAVDDTLFPLWTKRVLDKLGKGMKPIVPMLLPVVDKKAQLPDDFYGVRELWMCEEYTKLYSDGVSSYSMVTSTRLDDPDIRCNVCSECENPPLIQAIYKTTSATIASFTRGHLLRRGKIHNFSECELPCANTSDSSSEDIYDIDGLSLRVNFQSGTLNLLYYSDGLGECGYQMVPDVVFFLETIEKYIKFKIYEMLFNQATDESFQQLKYKMEKAEIDYSATLTYAQSWAKQPTREQKKAALIYQKTRLNKYKL